MSADPERKSFIASCSVWQVQPTENVKLQAFGFWTNNSGDNSLCIKIYCHVQVYKSAKFSSVIATSFAEFSAHFPFLNPSQHISRIVSGNHKNLLSLQLVFFSSLIDPECNIRFQFFCPGSFTYTLLQI